MNFENCFSKKGESIDWSSAESECTKLGGRLQNSINQFILSPKLVIIYQVGITNNIATIVLANKMAIGNILLAVLQCFRMSL